MNTKLKDLEKRFQEKLRQVGVQEARLSAREKEEGRKRLQGLFNSAPGVPWFSFGFLPSLARPVLAGVLAVLLLGGMAGVSFAAQGALPGEFLYPVKVGLNENLRAIALADSEARAEWEAERVERRLQEMEVLAERERLSPKALEAIEQGLERHLAKTYELSEGLELGKAQEVLSVVHRSLESHEGVVKSLQESSPAQKGLERLQGTIQKGLLKVQALEQKGAGREDEKEEDKNANKKEHSEEEQESAPPDDLLEALQGAAGEAFPQVFHGGGGKGEPERKAPKKEKRPAAESEEQNVSPLFDNASESAPVLQETSDGKQNSGPPPAKKEEQTPAPQEQPLKSKSSPAPPDAVQEQTGKQMREDKDVSEPPVMQKPPLDKEAVIPGQVKEELKEKKPDIPNLKNPKP